MGEGFADDETKEEGSLNYYNDNDPTCAATLRELMEMKLLPQGEIDTRSIIEVKPTELVGYQQCHFFAGCGGWVEALRLAGWERVEGVWSGSCPCPPFSQAGKKKYCPACEGASLISHPFETGVFCCVACGHEWFADGRHLWPEFYRLIRECRPRFVCGEQVAGTDGQVWLAGVRATLEGIGYGAWGIDLCAASIGAPQIRQRLFWMGFLPGARPHAGASHGIHCGEKSNGAWHGEFERSGNALGLAGSGCEHSAGWGEHRDMERAASKVEAEAWQWERLRDAAHDSGANSGMECSEGERRRMVDATNERTAIREIHTSANAGADGVGRLAHDARERRHGQQGTAESHGWNVAQAGGGLGMAERAGLQPREQVAATAGYGDSAFTAGDFFGMERTARNGREQGRPKSGGGSIAGGCGEDRIHDSWSDFELVPCADACVRRIETGTFPLVTPGMDKKSSGGWLARMLRSVVPGRNRSERRRNARRLAAGIVAAQKGRAQPAAQPMAHGVQAGMVRGNDSGISEDEFEQAQATAEGRVMRLRMYGNAIVPELAAEFIGAFEDAMEEMSQQGK